MNAEQKARELTLPERLLMEAEAWESWNAEFPRKAAVTTPPLLREAASALEQPEAGERVRGLYEELLYAVARKFPGESRHETALRYIRQAETQDNGPAKPVKQGGINGAA